MNPPPERDELIFEAALKLPPAERAGYLDQASAGDVELRERVKALLHDHEQAGRFMADAGAPPPDRTVSPDNPLRIPLVVRIYGILTMVLSVLGIVVLVLYIAPGGDALGLIIGGVVILLMAVVFRIGMGLRSGERQAVYGFCLLALLDVVFRLFSFAAKHDMQHLWFLAFALGLFYIPPVVSAFRHWAAFK
jgi:hypothetical protein